MRLPAKQMGARVGAGGSQSATEKSKFAFRLGVSSFSEWEPEWEPVGASVDSCPNVWIFAANCVGAKMGARSCDRENALRFKMGARMAGGRS